MERARREKVRDASFQSFTSASSLFSLTETSIGDIPDKQYSKVGLSEGPPSSKMASRQRTMSVSSLTSEGTPELTRILPSSLVITKEKGSSRNGSARPSRRTSAQTSRQTSKQNSAQNSGMTTPVHHKPVKPLSEAALRLNASLRSHNDRLTETPDKGLSSVFNADYNVAKTHSSNAYEDRISDDKNANDQLPSRDHSKKHAVNGFDDVATSGLTRNLSATEMKSPSYQAYTTMPINWSNTTKREQLHNAVDNKSDGDMTELLKLNAQLEGKLDMLSTEAETAIKQRAQYQAELGALKSKLQLYEQQGRLDEGYMPEENYNHLQKTVSDLQKRLLELQKLVELKSSECTRLSEGLMNAKELNSKLQMTVTSFGEQIKEKDSEVVALKSKILELDNQLANISSNSLTSADTISSLQDDIVSLTQTKEWYQKQLHTAQETRNILQAELTRLQNMVSSQADILERIKVENTQIKHQLTDTQRNALAEKQMLIRHLEAIEADMLEREAGYEQLEREKGVNETTWHTKMMQIEKERLSLSKLVTESSDLERQLQKANHDLSARIAEVTVLEAQQGELTNRLMESQNTLHQRNAEMENVRERLVEVESTLTKVQKQERERGQLLQNLKQEKATLQVALNSALEEKKAFAKAVEVLKSDTAKVELNYKSMKQDLAEKNQLIAAYKAEKSNFVSQLETVKAEVVSKYESVPIAEVSQLKKENGVLKEHMEHLKSDLEDSNDRVECLTVEKKTLEQQLANMKTNAVELEYITQKSHSEKTALEEKLKGMSAKLELHNKLRESDEIMEEKLTAQQHKVEGLQAELRSVESAMKERSLDYEKSTKLLTQQLQEALHERDSASRELRQHEETAQASASQQQEHLYAQLQMLRTQLDATQIQKGDLEAKISQYHTDVQDAVKEYQKRLLDSAAAAEQYKEQALQERAECEASIARHRAECESNKILNMELEREKGRLSAMKDQNAKLKQHAADIEAALAQRESSLVQLNAVNMTAQRKYDQLIEEQRMKIRQLEEDMNNQSATYDKLQKQFDFDHGSSEATQQLVDQLKLDSQCLQQELDKKTLALASIQTELATATEIGEKQNTNISMLNKEYRSAKLELEQLRRNVSENAVKNPIISDEIKALEWQVKQKSKEASDARNQLLLCEQRMEIETENIKKALAETNKELEFIKLELQGVRKDKFAYQSRVAMLRSALKNLLNESKVISEAISQTGVQPSTHIDVIKYEELLKETAAPGYKSKPLENLKSCLSNLHSEMSVLQQQMDDHKLALKSNSDSWKAVENEVADLRRMVDATGGTMLTDVNGMKTV